MVTCKTPSCSILVGCFGLGDTFSQILKENPKKLLDLEGEGDKSQSNLPGQPLDACFHVKLVGQIRAACTGREKETDPVGAEEHLLTGTVCLAWKAIPGRCLCMVCAQQQRMYLRSLSVGILLPATTQ